MKAGSRRGLVAVAGVLMATSLACQAILALDEPKGAARPDAVIEPAPVDPCSHARAPSPPESASGVDPRSPHWFIVQHVDFPLVDDAGTPRGYDLDEACTCVDDFHDGAPSCRSLVGVKSCDAPGGVDNTFARALASYAGVLDIGAAANRAAIRGERAVLLYLSGYNGEANDDNVGIMVVPSDGLFSNLGCDGQPRSDAALPGDSNIAPTNDGCDRWTVTQGRLLSPSPPTPIGNPNFGYVKNYQLVGSSRGTAIPLFGRVATIGDGVFTARIEPFTAVDGRKTFRLVDGIAAGRAPMTEFMDVISRAIVKPTGDQDASSDALCRTLLWPTIKKGLCESLDIMASPAADFQNVACDAFSLTWGFTAGPVLIDPVVRTTSETDAGCAAITTPQQLCAGP